ncbi:MAG TPA: hypothetical protein PKY35_06955 [Candidatus Hydrogenedentes bacterium]|nr:hypothetical protein [Candidatus Hydrogenedentota bacterium]HOL76753.1 hypothetical protein [Candidatus Hydrogenedentota bacterium]HPO85286.1 hypothetical protein [Candidatus Hydrogenedentota bacterium]
MSAEFNHDQHLPPEETPPFIRIAAPHHPWTRPLTNGLRHFPSVHFEEKPPSDVCRDLQRRQIDCGLVSPLEAWQMDTARVVPGIGVSSIGGAFPCSLFVRESCQAPRRIALAKEAQADAQIVCLVLAQCLQIYPELLSAEQNPEMLERVDAWMPAEDFSGQPAYTQRLDLSKLWHQTTGTPLVRALWVINSQTSSVEIRRVLALSLRRWEEESLHKHIPIVQGFYYKMGTAEVEGIQLMARCAAKYGICSGSGEIVFC